MAKTKPPLLPPGPTTADALLAAYVRRAEDWRRDHLGASILGHSCDRFLWLSFRWAADPRHDGQRLRLFDRGDRAEAWLIEDLRQVPGVKVFDRDPSTGEQFRVSWHGHLGGGLDGVVLGLLEDPETPHVLECKSHGSKSFARLKEKGVKAGKPEHYAQMQAYMLGKELKAAYYLAVCKDTDEIHAERVKFDREFAEALVAKGKAIVEMPEPPARKESPDFPPCVYTSKDGTKWPCQFYELCHGSVVPQKNCRTCVSSEPRPDGSWFCLHNLKAIDSPTQRVGCAAHLTVPSILNAAVATVDEQARRIDYQFADGRTHTDGPW